MRFINIITGSQSSAEADIEMFSSIIEAFARAGFAQCEYGVYTVNVYARAHMEQLRHLGVVFFTVTVENTTDKARRCLHEPKNPKRILPFADVARVIQEAEQIFPCVNTTIMLGYEPTDDLKRNFARIVKETRGTINHYILRIWLKSQYALLHPEAHRLEYYVDLFAFIERQVNAGKQTAGSFFAERFGIPPFTLRYRS